ncbi:MAG: primosomal replication protein [Colwellia sp.]
MRNNASSFVRLKSLLAQLRAQAIQVDSYNKNSKSHRLIENTDIFFEHLFSTKSNLFTPYIEEINTQLLTLERLVSNNNESLSKASLDNIEEQISAMVNALHSNQTRHQAAKLNVNAKNSARASRIKTAQKTKYQQLAKKVMLSSHQLYDKLKEHHEFERRLMDMVALREEARSSSSPSEAGKLGQEVLALHQRLGRCRKAISSIEIEIERAEKIK